MGFETDMDEKALLQEFVRQQRGAVIEKARGIDDAAAAARLVPSLTTIVGVVNHLAGVERWWLRVNMAGESDVPLPWSKDDVDADFKAAGVTIDAAIADYLAAAEESDAVVAAHSLDDVAARTNRHVGGHPSLRWILVHMVEETARHAGHVDILREQLDAKANV